MNIIGTLSTEVFVSIIAFFGVIVSAVLSSIISLFVSYRASKSRVAQFRKEWIEDLRIKLSEYISMTMEIRVENELSNRQGNDLLSEKSLILLQERLRLESYIKLSLNPDESEHINLLDIIDALSTPGTQETSIPSIVDTSRLVLKKEWDRLKSEI